MLIFSQAQNHKHLQINKEQRRRRNSHKRTKVEANPRGAPDTRAVPVGHGLDEEWAIFPLLWIINLRIMKTHALSVLKTHTLPRGAGQVGKKTAV